MADEKKPAEKSEKPAEKSDGKKPPKKKNKISFLGLVVLFSCSGFILTLVFNQVENILDIAKQGFDTLGFKLNLLVRSVMQFCLRVILIVVVFVLFVKALKAVLAYERKKSKRVRHKPLADIP